MRRLCLDSLRILAASRGEALLAEEQEHLKTCEACQKELAEQQRITWLLNDLGQAERAGLAPERLWQRIESDLEKPTLLTRLPLPLAAASRLAQEVLKPAVAAAWGVGIAGLLFGIWLAPRSPSAQADAPYGASSLVEGEVSLSAVYENSFNVEEDETQLPAEEGIGSDSSGSEEMQDAGGQP